MKARFELTYEGLLNITGAVRACHYSYLMVEGSIFIPATRPHSATATLILLSAIVWKSMGYYRI